MKSHPLKLERERRGWSQAHMATALGTNVKKVIRLEQGHALPSPFYRERLCTLFGKSASELGLLENVERDADEAVHEQISDEPPVHLSMPGQFWLVPTTPLPLVGRRQEMKEMEDLLSSVRLLTIIGAGGIGKTRVSLELVRKLRPRFPNGVCFVSLTAVREPEQVIPLIAYTLGLQDGSGLPFERVLELLREQAWLLVLDNFEHVTEAAPEVERLLINCPRLKVLVTSRSVLHLPSEYQYRLSPLTVPDLLQHPDRDTVAQSPSVQLFLQRARMLLLGRQIVYQWVIQTWFSLLMRLLIVHGTHRFRKILSG